ncbi:MAG TPA: ComEA family DNA-binding protein [Pseudonocardiaceae bacterium]
MPVAEPCDPNEFDADSTDPPGLPDPPEPPGRHDPPLRPAEPELGPDIEWLEPDQPDARRTPDRSSAPPSGRARKALATVTRRWLPADVRGWRFDPGRRAAVLLSVVVVLAAVVAGTLVWRSRPVAEPTPALAAAVEETAPGTELVVSIAGAVVRPGLVRLAEGARVADAVSAAGGPTPGTDLTGVNLARRLTDGEHVVIGPATPAAAPGGGQGGTPGGAPGSGSGSGARLDLNTATLADLDTLPGVGPVTAQRILDWRAEHGRFASIDQLREIEGIGETRFARLAELVLV